MLKVLGIEYAEEDFHRRFSDTYVRMKGNVVAHILRTNGESVAVNELSTSLYSDEITSTKRNISYADFDIVEPIPPAGYFNVCRDGILVAGNISYRTARQQQAGGCAARLSGLVTNTQDLARAYHGFFVSMAEAAQMSLLSGSYCAISRNFAIKGNKILYRTGGVVGRINTKKVMISDHVVDEMRELMEEEGVLIW